MAYEQIVDRNRGLLSETAQAQLRRATIAIAGCGADGGAPALSLARLGVRNFRLADPDTFDYSNINRQEGAFLSTRGQNKAETVAGLIRDIDDEANVKTYTEGLNTENIEEFLQGADLFLEEIDYRRPYDTLMAHRKARELNIPVFTVVSVAWNAFLFHFRPDGMTYEAYAGVQGDTVKTSADINLAAYAPEIPPYLSPELIQDILAERIEIPAVDPAVRMASALASSFSVFYLTGMKEILPVPHYYSAGDLLLKSDKVNAAISQEEVVSSHE